MKKMGIIGAVLLCVLFCGCQKQQKAPVKEKEQLTLWHYWDVAKNQDLLENLVNEFNNSQDEAEITIQYVPDEDFKKQLALSMAEGTMPDIALVDSSDFQYFHNMKPFADLTDRISELQDYLPEAMQPCTIDGKFYGQPFGLNCAALFYNETLLEEAGCKVPQNWEEFQETAAKVSKGDVSGYAITALPSEESMYQFLPIFWSMGGDVSEVNGAGKTQAFQLIRSMAEQGSLTKKSISMTMGDLTNQFTNGNIAMMINSSMAVDTITENAPDLKFGVTEIPGEQGEHLSVIGGEILAVSENGNEDKSALFLEFLADKKRMQTYMDEFGFLAPRADVMSSQFPDNELKHEFLDIFQSAKVREFTPEWPQISLEMSHALNRVIVGDGTNEDILNETAKSIEKIRGEE